MYKALKTTIKTDQTDARDAREAPLPNGAI